MNPVFDHVGLVCSDLSQSLDFYIAVLGGTAESQAGHTVITAGEVRIALVSCSPGDSMQHARGEHLAIRFSSEARSIILGRLATLKVAYEEVHGRVYVRDPDGFVVEFLFE